MKSLNKMSMVALTHIYADKFDRIQKNLASLDSINLTIETKKPTLSLSRDVVTMELVNLNQRARDQERIFAELKQDLQLISTIKQLNQDSLSESAKNLLSSEDNIHHHLDNDTRILTIAENYNNEVNVIHGRLNARLHLIDRQTNTITSQIEDITNLMQLHAEKNSNPLCESLLQSRIQDVNKLISINDSIKTLKSDLIQLSSKLTSLENEMQQEHGLTSFKIFNARKNNIEDLSNTLYQQERYANEKLPQYKENLDSLNNDLNKCRDAKETDNFKNLDGDRFDQFKSFIQQSSYYKELNKYKDTSRQKRDLIETLILGIDHSTNLHELMTLISPTYRNTLPNVNNDEFLLEIKIDNHDINENDDVKNININNLDRELRRTQNTGFFNYETATLGAYKSTTDRYLKNLEKDALSYIEDKYHLDIKNAPAKPVRNSR